MREYAFLMVRYGMTDFVKDIQKEIPDDILYTDPDGSDIYGKEDDAHVTLAPCLDNDVDLEELKTLLSPIRKYAGYITDISKFERKDYDVLKCNVVSEPMSATNKKILSKFESHSEYKDSYRPHLTIAYLKKGQADRFCKRLKSFVKIEPTEFLFSYIDNGEEKSIAFEK